MGAIGNIKSTEETFQEFPVIQCDGCIYCQTLNQRKDNNCMHPKLQLSDSQGLTSNKESCARQNWIFFKPLLEELILCEKWLMTIRGRRIIEPISFGTLETEAPRNYLNVSRLYRAAIKLGYNELEQANSFAYLNPPDSKVLQVHFMQVCK